MYNAIHPREKGPKQKECLIMRFEITITLYPKSPVYEVSSRPYRFAYCLNTFKTMHYVLFRSLNLMSHWGNDETGQNALCGRYLNNRRTCKDATKPRTLGLFGHSGLSHSVFDLRIIRNVSLMQYAFQIWFFIMGNVKLLLQQIKGNTCRLEISISLYWLDMGFEPWTFESH